MKKVVFVADMFAHQYAGGAKLTTEALIRGSTSSTDIIRINSSQLTIPILKESHDLHYIVCNFASLDDKVKLHMCKNIDYSIVEYDYKFCQYRSMEKHLKITGNECDCVEQMSGKINSAFYGYAKKIWFMSEGQRDIFLSKVKTIKEDKCEVLSSVFADGDIRFMKSIKDNEKDDKYLILGSSSWIKGVKECVQHAKDNGLNYEIVQNLPYHELLIKMSCSKGLIFLPLGYDTCPRFVIEAKMLGCELILNKHVQHKDESWFETQDSCYSYLENRKNTFWSYYAE